MNRDQKDWVNKYILLEPHLEELLGHDLPQNKMIFCPFHPNSDTKAAKFYEDSNTIYCFGECNRHYRTYDVLNKIGWTEEEILALVPSDVGPIDKQQIKYPIVTKEELKGRQENFMKFLEVLEEKWENRDNIEGRTLDEMKHG